MINTGGRHHHPELMLNLYNEKHILFVTCISLL